MRLQIALFLMAIASFAHVSMAASKTIVIPMHDTQNPEKSIGTITVKDTAYGALLVPQLHDLPPGTHGFHVHEKPSCEDHGASAGAHLDPKHTQAHDGPYSKQGHLGDLPVLIVNADGTALIPVLAPRLRISQMTNRSFIIHAGSDNYSDQPEKLGGGGKRIACGIIQ